LDSEIKVTSLDSALCYYCKRKAKYLIALESAYNLLCEDCAEKEGYILKEKSEPEPSPVEVFVSGNDEGRYVALVKDRAIHGTIKGRHIEAEHSAIFAGVLEALKLKTRHVKVYSDSSLVIRQLKHECVITEANLRDSAVRIWNLIQGRAVPVEFILVKKGENKARNYLRNRDSQTTERDTLKLSKGKTERGNTKAEGKVSESLDMN